VLRKNQVSIYEVPKWPELSVGKMFDLAMSNVKGFSRYMPDEYIGDAKTDRGFFWGVFITLNPDLVREIVADCRKQRQPIAKQMMPDINKTTVSRKWATELLSQPPAKGKCKQNPFNQFLILPP
jgi:hypothetical protein